MIKLKNILLEIENVGFEYAYHAGPNKLSAKFIQFDKGAMGFHVGTLNQAEWVAAGKTGKSNYRNPLPISKFKVFHELPNGLDLIPVDIDMAWEHADILLIELIHNGFFGGNLDYIHNLIDSWNDVDEEKIKELHELVDIARSRRGDENFFARDAFEEMSLDPSVYKNREKLSQIRNLIVTKEHIGALEYPNSVEGTESGYSICILDKSMIEDA